MRFRGEQSTHDVTLKCKDQATKRIPLWSSVISPKLLQENDINRDLNWAVLPGDHRMWLSLNTLPIRPTSSSQRPRPKSGLFCLRLDRRRGQISSLPGFAGVSQGASTPELQAMARPPDPLACAHDTSCKLHSLFRKYYGRIPGRQVGDPPIHLVPVAMVAIRSGRRDVPAPATRRLATQGALSNRGDARCSDPSRGRGGNQPT